MYVQHSLAVIVVGFDLLDLVKPVRPVNMKYLCSTIEQQLMQLCLVRLSGGEQC